MKVTDRRSTHGGWKVYGKGVLGVLTDGAQCNRQRCRTSMRVHVLPCGDDTRSVTAKAAAVSSLLAVLDGLDAGVQKHTAASTPCISACYPSAHHHLVPLLLTTE